MGITMKQLLPLIFLSISITCIGQKTKYQFKVKEHIIPASSIILAGIAEGFQDLLAFHNNSNNIFWGKDSYKNKYYNRDPSKGLTFQGRYLVFTTDGFHLMKWSKNLFLFSGIAFKIGQPKRKWYIYLIEGIAYYSLNRLAFNVIWETVKIK